MAVLLIPTPSGAPYSSSKVRLEGRDFVLQLAWNQRQGRWHLSILDEESTPLAMGLKLVANWPLTRAYKWDPRLPPGDFRAMSLTGDRSPPGFDELGIGKRCELTYFESGS